MPGSPSNQSTTQLSLLAHSSLLWSVENFYYCCFHLTGFIKHIALGNKFEKYGELFLKKVKNLPVPSILPLEIISVNISILPHFSLGVALKKKSYYHGKVGRITYLIFNMQSTFTSLKKHF